MKTILHLCADTGSDTKPYKDNGYNVVLVGSKIARLNERKNSFCHYSTKELEDMIATYQQKIKSRETVKKYI